MIPFRKILDQELHGGTRPPKLDVDFFPPRFYAVNWRGLCSLAWKEIYRFIKIWEQTLVSPLVMTLLFYAVFAVGFREHGAIGSLPFLTFIIPGLVMMAVAQSAFVNGAVSLVLSKLQGNIVDILMPPLSPLEIVVAYVFGGVVRGLMVGAIALGALAFMAPIHFASIPYALFFAIMGALMLSLIGVITGVSGDRFDHIGAIQNFLIMPATFLSGTFFTVSQLPEKLQIVCFINPFYYMIDGFRYGMTGVSDVSIIGGMGLLICVNLVLLHVVYWLVAKGTGLKQ